MRDEVVTGGQEAADRPSLAELAGNRRDMRAEGPRDDHQPEWVGVLGGRGYAAGGGRVGAAGRSDSLPEAAPSQDPQPGLRARLLPSRRGQDKRARLGAYHGEAAGGAHRALAPRGLGLPPREAELWPLRTCYL